MRGPAPPSDAASLGGCARLRRDQWGAQAVAEGEEGVDWRVCRLSRPEPWGFLECDLAAGAGHSG